MTGPIWSHSVRSFGMPFSPSTQAMVSWMLWSCRRLPGKWCLGGTGTPGTRHGGTGDTAWGGYNTPQKRKKQGLQTWNDGKTLESRQFLHLWMAVKELKDRRLGWLSGSWCVILEWVPWRKNEAWQKLNSIFQTLCGEIKPTPYLVSGWTSRNPKSFGSVEKLRHAPNHDN